MTDQPSHPLPDDPALAEVAASLQGAGHWGWVVDPQWRILFVTDELRLTFGGNVELADWPIGVHMFSPEFLAATRQFRFGTTTDELFRSNFAAVGGWVLTDTPGGREELRTIVDPVLHDMVDDHRAVRRGRPLVRRRRDGARPTPSACTSSASASATATGASPGPR